MYQILQLGRDILTAPCNFPISTKTTGLKVAMGVVYAKRQPPIEKNDKISQQRTKIRKKTIYGGWLEIKPGRKILTAPSK